MINQYTIPLSTKGNIVSKIIFSLINAPALNIALDLCFVKKNKKKKKKIGWWNDKNSLFISRSTLL